MSFNHNYHCNYSNNSTFHPPHRNFFPNPICVPPPPPPTHYSSQPSDRDIVKQFENIIEGVPKCAKIKPKIGTISEAKAKIKQALETLNTLKSQELELKNNIANLSEEEWNLKMKDIETNKATINNFMTNINDSYLATLRKLIAKRTAKRLRLKRVHLERKRQKEERIRENQEKSRKIDENLQKIKDEINKTKQEEEAKQQADLILKEVLRKKHDAKKFITKLEALVKLRKAIENTAKGRGEKVSESETNNFITHIDKIKALWIQKQILYEKEESDLRDKLKDNSAENAANKDNEATIVKNLAKWHKVLFGGKGAPQVDFGGDVSRFVSVRTQWDQYVSPEGSSLPIGWVVPSCKS